MTVQTYYVDIVPEGAEPPEDGDRARHELVVEATGKGAAIHRAAATAGVWMVTGVRDWSKPGRIRFKPVTA